MVNIQGICERITEKVARELMLEETQIAVVSYGLFAIIQTVICILLAIIFGMIFRVLVPTLIVSLAAVILRKYSGGAHADTPEGCAIIGTIVSVGGALIVSSISWDVKGLALIGTLLFGGSFYIIYKLAPVDSKAKPIKKLEKRKMLKKKSIYAISAYLVICIIGIALYLNDFNKQWLVYSACIYIGTGWQTFTLTSAGHLLIAEMDSLFNKLIKRQ